jgi:hypothetical protein
MTIEAIKLAGTVICGPDYHHASDGRPRCIFCIEASDGDHYQVTVKGSKAKDAREAFGPGSRVVVHGALDPLRKTIATEHIAPDSKAKPAKKKPPRWRDDDNDELAGLRRYLAE